MKLKSKSGRCLIKVSLLNLMMEKYPYLTKGQASSILNDVRQSNGGTLMGLTMKSFKVWFLKLKNARGFKQANKYRKSEVTKTREEISCLNRTCHVCYRLFSRKEHRERHIRMVHKVVKKNPQKKKEGSEKFICQECNNTYAHEVSLQRHMESHEKFRREIHCDKCVKTFTRQDSLWRHREKVHKLLNMNIDSIMQKEENDCNLCKKQFENKDKLLAHISLKACFSQLTCEEKFQCNDCPKSYVYKSDLNRHRKNSHYPANEEWKCMECDQRFTYKSSFSRHMREKH